MGHPGLSYALIMLAAIVAAIVLQRRSPRKLPLTGRQRTGVALGAFCGAMLGAKLPFVLADWEGLMTGRVWFDNGKTIMFGMVGGYFGVELAKALLGIRLKTGDSFAVPVAVAVAIGRVACFQAGCCFGSETGLPWGVDFGDGLRRHPTQLYETAFHLCAAGGLACLQRRGLCRGQLIKLYFLTYFVYRFATEFIRPETRLWLGLTGYQWTALVFIPLFLALWIHDARRAAEPNRMTGTV
ncbi:MAG TPA: prolipoprotein diacylglyceryl transferase family protein [Planctomycetaceae bacterium]|nr:prolipoprotein diacylglyceryl transferase family protein [Planctomycetaceae bacterium]